MHVKCHRLGKHAQNGDTLIVLENAFKNKQENVFQISIQCKVIGCKYPTTVEFPLPSHI